MRVRPLIAELFGTFVLALLVRLSLGATMPLATPVLAALTLGFLVYAIGPVSGAHVNPAVTIGLWSIGKIKPVDAIGYIVSQCVGAFLALTIAPVLVSVMPALTTATTKLPAFGEAAGAALFVFGIASVVYGKAPASLSGVVVGTALLLGVLVASTVSLGILNPAVAFVLGSLSVPYIVGPIAGAIVGAWAYRLLSR